MKIKDTPITMADFRLQTPDVEIYLAMSHKFSLPPEIADRLSFHQLKNPTAAQLAAKLDQGRGKLGVSGQFTPMYQNCSRSLITALSKHYLKRDTRFWLSYRSYKDYHVVLIQPDNKYRTLQSL